MNKSSHQEGKVQCEICGGEGTVDELFLNEMGNPYTKNCENCNGTGWTSPDDGL